MKYINLFFLLLFVACKVPASKQTAESGMKTSLSSYAMIFIDELKMRVPSGDISCSFIPDSVFMKKYGLKVNEKGECIIDGIITMKEGAVLPDSEINLNHLYKNKYHCRLPLCKLYKLLSNPEVIYFDLSKPVIL